MTLNYTQERSGEALKERSITWAHQLPAVAEELPARAARRPAKPDGSPVNAARTTVEAWARHAHASNGFADATIGPVLDEVRPKESLQIREAGAS